MLHDVFIFLLMMYLFVWDVYVRGRHYVFISVSCFTCTTLAIDLYYEVIHDKSRIYFVFTCIFHTCVYVFVECYRNIQVDSVVLLSTLATDR